MAWRIAMYQRAKRLPSLSSILNGIRRKTRPSKPAGPTAVDVGKMAEARLKELGRTDILSGLGPKND